MNTRTFSFPRDSQRNTRYGKRRLRLRLEVLEDRCLPSAVMNLNDSGFGSLRQAIIDTPSGGIVNFQSGLSGTITLTSGELAIGKDLNIVGPGSSVITVSGDHASPVFDIAATETVAISGLTIANGTGVDGGGILNDGTLTLSDSTVEGNTAAIIGGGISNHATGMLTINNSSVIHNQSDSVGGGIYNAGGAVTITDSNMSDNTAGFAGGGVSAASGIISGTGSVTIARSTISGNTAVRGGGIIAGSGPVIVMDSTIVGNTATADGGGVVNFNGGPGTNTRMIISNSTISGNSALMGGGISNAVNAPFPTLLTVTSSTISGNTGSSAGGGIFNHPSGTVTIGNTILAGNTSSASPDMSGSLDSQGHNLIGDGTGGSGFANTDLVGTSTSPIDPKLGPLQDNGGPTQTMALLHGSPAIDAGDNAFAPGPFDQRGPGFPRIVNGIIDIGAFEVQAVALTVQCSVTVPVLWPPNHQLVNVGLSVQVSDPNATIRVQVYANDGALPSDAADLAPGTLRLRSQRQGGGSGRVYLIVVTATDAAGNVAVSECTVVVPHDQSAHSLAAVEQQAAEAEAYFQAFQTAPPKYRLLG
jgi:hypothetical protein